MAVSKQAAQKFEGERFNLRKINELEFRKQYKIEISNRFEVLENLSESEEINRTWENIKERENIKENIRTSAQESLGLCKLKQH